MYRCYRFSESQLQRLLKLEQRRDYHSTLALTFLLLLAVPVEHTVPIVVTSMDVFLDIQQQLQQQRESYSLSGSVTTTTTSSMTTYLPFDVVVAVAYSLGKYQCRLVQQKPSEYLDAFSVSQMHKSKTYLVNCNSGYFLKIFFISSPSE